MNKNILTAAFVAMAFLLPTLGRAAIIGDPVEGILRSVYSDFITLSVEPDSAKSADSNSADIGELSVKVDTKTAYTNFNQLADLKEGDRVRVEYRDDDNTHKNKKIVATTITKLPPPPVDTVTVVPADTMTVHQTTVTTTTTTDPQTVTVVNQ